MDDLISRDAVKELLNNNGLPHHINPILWKELNDLPSAQPNTGKWISADAIFGGVPFYCSECGENTRDTVMGKPRYNFCPMCGAKMGVTE